MLITGESGVGKDLVARYIHSHSARSQAPFVALNCAGLSEMLLESAISAHADVRIIAATHRDLRRMVREGQFRETSSIASRSSICTFHPCASCATTSPRW